MAARREDGFTLVELLLAISVMLVIIVPLSTSFVLGLQTASGGLQDTTNSVDAQVVAGFFDTDVANAETVSGTGTCGGSSGIVLQLAWTDGSSAVTVAYRTVEDPAMKAELALSFAIDRLERVRCVGGSLVDTTVVARSLLRSVPVVVTCDAGSCGSGAKPKRVSMTVVEHTDQLGDAGSSTRYTFGVTAMRKVTA